MPELEEDSGPPTPTAPQAEEQSVEEEDEGSATEVVSTTEEAAVEKDAAEKSYKCCGIPTTLF